MEEIYEVQKNEYLVEQADNGITIREIGLGDLEVCYDKDSRYILGNRILGEINEYFKCNICTTVKLRIEIEGCDIYVP